MCRPQEKLALVVEVLGRESSLAQPLVSLG